VKRFWLIIVGLAVLGGVSILAANFFPDQTYEALKGVTAWVGAPVFGATSPPPVQQKNPTSKAQTVRFVLLPASEKILQCSRPWPKVDASWKATAQDVAKLESNLSHISSLRSAGSIKGARIERPENYYRQYLTVVVSGRKLIYVNAFDAEVPDWREHFVTICDGGGSVWGVLYDPSTGEFFDLEVNGLA